MLSGRDLQLVRVLFMADFLASGTIVLFISLPFITARTGKPTRSGVRLANRASPCLRWGFCVSVFLTGVALADNRRTFVGVL